MDKKLANALSQLADELDDEWQAGTRSGAFDLTDMTEILRRLAEKLDGKAKRNANHTQSA
jgi:hypothetical protein